MKGRPTEYAIDNAHLYCYHPLCCAWLQQNGFLDAEVSLVWDCDGYLDVVVYNKADTLVWIKLFQKPAADTAEFGLASGQTLIRVRLLLSFGGEPTERLMISGHGTFWGSPWHCPSSHQLHFVDKSNESWSTSISEFKFYLRTTCSSSKFPSPFSGLWVALSHCLVDAVTQGMAPVL